MLIDTHCHVTWPEFNADRTETIARAYAAGVTQMVIVGTDLATSRAAILLAETDPALFATVGIHPHESGRTDSALMQELSLLADHPKVVGIGETGLDFYYNHASVSCQCASFIEHIRLAQRKRLPLIIHTRDAWKETFEILAQEERRHALASGMVFHCFTGDAAIAQQAMAIGAYISFSGIVTFPKAVALHEAAAMAHSDRIVIETDAPYLAPQGHRGGRNEPAYLRTTAEQIAKLRSASFEDTAKQTSDNARRLFRLL